MSLYRPKWAVPRPQKAKKIPNQYTRGPVKTTARSPSKTR